MSLLERIKLMFPRLKKRLYKPLFLVPNIDLHCFCHAIQEFGVWMQQKVGFVTLSSEFFLVEEALKMRIKKIVNQIYLLELSQTANLYSHYDNTSKYSTTNHK